MEGNFKRYFGSRIREILCLNMGGVFIKVEDDFWFWVLGVWMISGVINKGKGK